MIVDLCKIYILIIMHSPNLLKYAQIYNCIGGTYIKQYAPTTMPSYSPAYISPKPTTPTGQPTSKPSHPTGEQD